MKNIDNKVKKILTYHLFLDKNYFNGFSDNGNNLLLSEIVKDPLVAYEILEDIESIFNIMINDQNINNNTTIGEFISMIEKEVNKNDEF